MVYIMSNLTYNPNVNIPYHNNYMNNTETYDNYNNYDNASIL